MSKQIEHVQFLSTCRTNEQQVAVEEAGVDGFVDISNEDDCKSTAAPNTIAPVAAFLRFFAIVF